MNYPEPNSSLPEYSEGELKNLWTMVSTKRVYESPWTQIDEDELLGPGGISAIYRVVNMKPGVMIAALTTNGEVFLVGQHRYAVDRFSWEVIGGAIDVGEEAQDAAKRELKEESGLEASQWTYLGNADLGTAYIRSKVWFYLAEGLTAGEASPETGEDLMLKKIPFNEAQHMVRAGKITHLPSVALLLKVGDLLGNR